MNNNNNNNELDDDVYNKIRDKIECTYCTHLNVIIDIINNHPNFNINMKVEHGNSLLPCAVDEDKYEIVEYFINELNADIHICNNLNYTPIIYAASSKVLIFLINNGANMYHVTNEGYNVLMYAVHYNRKEVIKTLINKYDYNIDMKDKFNRSVFHHVYCHNKKDRYDNLVSICKKNDLNRIYVLQEFIDIGCVNNNNDDISPSIQGISHQEAYERAVEIIGNNNEELLRRQIAIERIPLLFNTQKGSMFDYRLVGMIFEYINTKPLIPEWEEWSTSDEDE